MRTIAYLALGSNLGDREAKLLEAQKRLSEHPNIEIQKASKIYETEPWPKHEVVEGRLLEEEKQGWHLNQVLCVSTSLSAFELLAVTQEVEKNMGKSVKTVWGSREIDIDILLYGEEILDSPELSLPHRHMHDRQFVLIPLLEIAPHLKDPRTGKLFQEFLDEIDEEHGVVALGTSPSLPASSHSKVVKGPPPAPPQGGEQNLVDGNK